MLCKIFGHKWDHCKCPRCGATRDEGHVWDGCVCSVCGKTRREGHSYEPVPNGYYEFRLGPNYTGRSELLGYHRLRCSKCGAEKRGDHTWTGKGCATKCAVCGAKPVNFTIRYSGFDIDLSHQWTGGTCADTCRLCGIRRPGGAHRWTGNTCLEPCELCGVIKSKGHRWSGDTCTDTCALCGARYPNGKHDYEEAETTQTASGTKVGLFRCRRCGKEYKAPYDFSSSDSV